MLVQTLEFMMIGLALGSIYALLSLAMKIIWITTRVFDISIGAQAALAGILSAAVGLPYGLFVGVVAGLCSGAVAAMVFLAFHAHREIRDATPMLLSTFALLLIIESLILTMFGPDGKHMEGISGVIFVGGAILVVQGIVCIGVAFAVYAAMAVLLKWTPVGLKMRASAVSERSALLAGIPVRRVQFFTFVLGGGIAGIAGVLAATLVGLTYSSSFGLTVAGLSGALLFGKDTPSAAFVGGVAIGIIETLGQAFLPSGWAGGTSALVILLVLATSRTSSLTFAGARP